MKRIFISRSLDPSSPIRQIAHQHEIIDESLLRFSALEFEMPEADWIFFYSRNGVRFFFEQGNYALYPYLWACMSEGTADELSQYVQDISFVGNGNPEDVAASLMNSISPSENICFVRAQISKDSVRELTNRTSDFSLPIYDNVIADKNPSGNFDILIFTSPMNADAWFEKADHRGESIISIGPTTAKHLKDRYGIDEVLVAPKPSEKGIADCLQQIL